MKLVFTIINMVLAAGAIYLGMGIYRQLADGSPALLEEPSGAQASATPPAPPADRSRSRYNAVVARDLFGTARSDQTGLSQTRIDQLKPTVLKLKLWGTVTGNQDPSAVIEDLKTRQQVLYHTGDSVQGATIKMIFRDKVVINAGGKDEVLALEEAGSASGPSRPAMAGPGPAMPPPGTAPQPAAPPAEPPTQPSPIQSLTADDHMAKIGLEPQFANGDVSGLKINRIAPDSPLQRMGLRPGDVITGFNEQNMTDPADVKALFEELQESGEVQVTIQRQGKQQQINLKQ